MRSFRGIIYQATNKTNGKRYIGKTFTNTYNYSYERLLSRRMSGHKCLMTKDDKQYFHKALTKYGWENFMWQIIEKIDNKADLDERETYWIIENNTFAPGGKGYNLTLGGDGSVGLPSSEKAKRLSRERTIKPIVEITTRKEYESITDACKELGVTNSMVWAILTRNDNSIHTKGYSFAYKNEYYRNVEYYEELAKKIKYRGTRSAKKIINIETKEIFNSALQAAKFYKLDASSIIKCCKRNKRNTHCGGYVWRYLEEYENTEVTTESNKSVAP